MFNELTLSLHILLLVSIYIFLFVVIKTIAKDMTAPEANISDNSQDDIQDSIIKKDAGTDPDELELEYSKVLFVSHGADEVGIAYTIYDELIIGRAPDCDIVLDDSFVSSHHVRVYQVGADYWLEDLNSTNGTLMEKARLDTPVRLTHGDEFIISDNIFKFVG